MLHINNKQLKIIKSILKKYLPDYEILAFGSRVHGRQLKPFSDIDLVIRNQNPLPPKLLNKIRDSFNESNLDIKVDITDWLSLTSNFQKLILEEYEVLDF